MSLFPLREDPGREQGMGRVLATGPGYLWLLVRGEYSECGGFLPPDLGREPNGSFCFSTRTILLLRPSAALESGDCTDMRVILPVRLQGPGEDSKSRAEQGRARNIGDRSWRVVDRGVKTRSGPFDSVQLEIKVTTHRSPIREPDRQTDG